MPARLPNRTPSSGQWNALLALALLVHGGGAVVERMDAAEARLKGVTLAVVKALDHLGDAVALPERVHPVVERAIRRDRARRRIRHGKDLLEDGDVMRD